MTIVVRVQRSALALLLATGFAIQSAAQTPLPPQTASGTASSSSSVDPTSSEPVAPSPARSPRISAPSQSAQQVDLYREPVRPFSKLAIGLEGGTLGIGAQVATPLTRSLNLRGGVDLLNFGYGLAVDAAQYEGEAHLRSGHLSVDFHPLGAGFRISPELLFFESSFSASVYITGGQVFDLGDTTYSSSATDPVHGRASITIERRVMPALTIGWGNMLGQRRRHWSIPLEIGAAYTGHYTLSLNLAGTACLNGTNCLSTSTPEVQTSVQQEESDLSEIMKHFQVYPIVSTGVAYRF